MKALSAVQAERLTDAMTLQWFERSGTPPHKGGAFRVQSCIDKAEMLIIATTTDGWDHVSVSRRNRCPNWAELEQVKRAFFQADETAMQLHVPSTDHVNCHPYCLHLWRPQHVDIPRPPSWMVL